MNNKTDKPSEEHHYRMSYLKTTMESINIDAEIDRLQIQGTLGFDWVPPMFNSHR